jgi:hypothetical protein
LIENGPVIQEQNGLFFLPDRFYCLCSPGQTAQLVVLASDETGIDIPLYRSGVKDRDAPVVPGKNGNRGNDDKQNKQQQWKD